jgi:cytosine/adenosine deaminase-related metal-dependent hydrolase
LKRRIAGHIFQNGEMARGTLVISDDGYEIVPGILNDSICGTIIPSLVNAHTHLGDSFITKVPAGSISETVGPGGFKEKALSGATSQEITRGMSWAQEVMLSTGTTCFVDFRESGMKGVKLLRNTEQKNLRQVILGRPSGDDRAGEVLSVSEGIALSSLNDLPLSFILETKNAVKKQGKIFAMHFSENVRESIENLAQVAPDFIVHGIETSESELEQLAEMKIPVVITPHSNVFYGKRPDYSRFARKGIATMLGTDNGMITSPNLLAEMSFLYHYQRQIDSLEPSYILNMATEVPRQFFRSLGIGIPDSFVLFPNVLLTEREIVTRGTYYNRKIIQIA